MLIRELARVDLPAAVAIEKEGADIPWPWQDMAKAIRGEAGMKAIGVFVDGELAGHAVFDIDTVSIYVCTLTVSPGMRRRGIASRLIEYAFCRIDRQRPVIRAFVRDSTLDVQLFLKAKGFLAVDVDRKFWDDADAYLFQFHIDPAQNTGPLQDNLLLASTGA